MISMNSEIISALRDVSFVQSDISMNSGVIPALRDASFVKPG